MVEKNKIVNNLLNHPVLRGSRNSALQGAFMGSEPSHAGTVFKGFEKQLTCLLEYLDSSTPFFVRCIKPNDEQKPNVFDSGKVNKQLRSAGIPAVIRIRKAGFPVR
jgi:myosin heavy subunit